MERILFNKFSPKLYFELNIVSSLVSKRSSAVRGKHIIGPSRAGGGETLQRFEERNFQRKETNLLGEDRARENIW